MTTEGHSVCPGGPADGRLVPGDQLVKINNVAVDDLTPEQAAEIIRSTHATALTHTHTRTLYRYLLVQTDKKVFKIRLRASHLHEHYLNRQPFFAFQGVSRNTDSNCPPNDAGESARNTH